LIERVRGAATPAAEPTAAPAPKNHFFVFMETENQQPIADMETVLKKAEGNKAQMDEISFCNDKFQFIDNDRAPYIEKIKVMGSVYRVAIF